MRLAHSEAASGFRSGKAAAQQPVQPVAAEVTRLYLRGDSVRESANSPPAPPIGHSLFPDTITASGTWNHSDSTDREADRTSREITRPVNHVRVCWPQNPLHPCHPRLPWCPSAAGFRDDCQPNRSIPMLLAIPLYGRADLSSVRRVGSEDTQRRGGDTRLSPPTTSGRTTAPIAALLSDAQTAIVSPSPTTPSNSGALMITRPAALTAKVPWFLSVSFVCFVAIPSAAEFTTPITFSATSVATFSRASETPPVRPC